MTTAHRTVMITGAAGHLGRAVAEAFDAQGTALVLLDRSADRLQQAFGGAGPRSLLLPTDLLDRAQVAEAVRGGAEGFGRIEVLCNLPGGLHMAERSKSPCQPFWPLPGHFPATCATSHFPATSQPLPGRTSQPLRKTCFFEISALGHSPATSRSYL